MPVPRWLFVLVTSGTALGVAACAGSAGDPSTDITSSGVSTAVVDTAAPASASTVASPDSSETGLSTTVSSPSSTSSTGTETTASDEDVDETTTTAAPEPSTSESSTPETTGQANIPIRLRLDRRVDDEATANFASLAQEILTDARGWGQAGFVFSFDDTDFDYTIVLAEGSEVDSLCLPYDTFGRFSCQIGPVVALNADRWRTAVESWPASLDDYRTMLVNHEVGHLLGQHHPESRCPGAGAPAPVMAQQSSGVDPCTANPWPLAWEIECAQLGLEPLAPPYERNISLTCGPAGPVG